MTSIALAPVLASAAEARRWVDGRLADIPAELRRTIALLVSELVANAVVHAGAPVTVAVRSTGSLVHVAVSDGSRQVPMARDHDPEADSGRGLTVVATLADDWGTRVDEEGKVVWFTVAIPTGPIPKGPESSTGNGTASTAAYQRRTATEGKADCVDLPFLPPDTPHGRLS